MDDLGALYIIKSEIPPYFRVRYHIHFAARGQTWLKILQDQGYNHIPSYSSDQKPIKEEIRSRSTGQPRSTPSLLDGNGVALNEGLPAVFLPPTHIYREVPYGPLGLEIPTFMA